MPKRSTKRAFQFSGLGHLIVLAGPSGCGKTTFVRSLYSGTCDPEIRAVLPHGAEKAPSIDTKYPDRLLVNSMKTADGISMVEIPTTENVRNASVIILHYALNRLGNMGISRLSEDEVLLHFVRQAKQSVTIINVRPDDKELAALYAFRSFGKTGTGNALWRIFSRLSKISKFKMYLKYRYFFEGHRLFSRWDDMMFELAKELEPSSRPTLRVLNVKPCLDAAASWPFVLNRN